MIAGKKLSKTYVQGSVPVKALKGADFEIKKGQMVAITGPSGSGKSTLLHLLGLLDSPTSGSLWLEGKDVSGLSERRKGEIRLRKIGYVFQEFYLIPELSALENVSLPAMASGVPDPEAKAAEMLRRVGLEDRLHHIPSQLSGGEQQRVAVARALVNDPLVILADEPTANLDSANGEAILRIFKKLNKDRGQTIILITHEPEHLALVDFVYHLRDGILSGPD
jgi:putative ABC transport system ATP-binding protein